MGFPLEIKIGDKLLDLVLKGERKAEFYIMPRSAA